MHTKYILIVVAFVAAFVLMSWLRSRSVSRLPANSPQQVSLIELTDGEKHV